MKKIFTLLFISTMLFSCSQDSEIVGENELVALSFDEKLAKGDFDDSNLGIYKGVFTTLDGKNRATVSIIINEKSTPTVEFKFANKEKISLIGNGHTEKAQEINKMQFDQGDLKFDFSVDENGSNPTMSNVTYKNKEGAALMQKETSKAPINPITGVYTCIDCDSHPVLGKGFSQTFNFVFSGTGDGATVLTQGTLNGRVYGSTGTTSDVVGGNGLIQQNCTVNGTRTTCDLVTNGPVAFFGDSGPVTIIGTHTYNNEPTSNGNDCSNIIAQMDYNSTRFGLSELLIQTDVSDECPAIGTQLLFEDFEDGTVGYDQRATVSGADGSEGDHLEELPEQNDYYGIFINRDPSNVSYVNKIGNGYYGAQDTDGVANAPATRIRLLYSNIDVSSYTTLDFSIFFATDDEEPLGDWDQTSRAGIEYSFDGGTTWIKVIAIEAGPGDPDADKETDVVYEDLDFDGIGDETATRIGQSFTKLNKSISTGGNANMMVRIYMRVLNNDQEDIAIDNFSLFGR